MANGTEVNQEEYRKLVREITNTENQLKTLNAKVDENKVKFDALGESAGKVNNFMKNAGIAALGAGTGIVAMGLNAAAAADDINTLATQTGLSTDQIQIFQYASDRIDVSLETLTGSMAKLTKNMYSAQQGSKNQKAAFDALGVAITDNDGKLRNNQDVMNDAINALSKMENETQRDAYAMQIFGKSAQDLNPLILGGADALNKMAEEARASGIILDEETLQSANKLNDAVDNLKATATGAFSKIGAEIAEGLTPYIEPLAGMIAEFGNFIVENQDGIVAALGAIGTALLTFNIVTTIQGVIQKFLEMKKATEGLTTAQAALNLIMSANPIALIAAAIAGLVAAFVILWNKSEDFRNFWIGLWEGIKSACSAAWEAIKGFFNSAWEGVKAIWGIATAYFQMVWNNIKAVFSVVESVLTGDFRGAWEGIKQIWSNVSSFFEEVWQKIKSAFNISDMLQIGKDLLTGLWNGISDKVEWLKGKVKGVVDKIKSWFTGKDGFDEHSPSKWSEKVFAYLIDGGVIGISKNASKAIKAAKGVVEDVKNAFTSKEGFDIHSPSIFGEDVGYNLIAGIPIGIDKAKSLVDESLDSLISDTKEKLEDGMDTIADTKSSPFSETKLARAQRLGTTIEEVKSKGLSEEIRFFASSMEEARKILSIVGDAEKAGKNIRVQFGEKFDDAGTLVDKWVEAIDDTGKVFWRKQQKAVTEATQDMLEREENYFLLKERLESGFYDKYGEEHKKTMESYLERDRKFIEEERKLYGIQIKTFNDLDKSNEELIKKKKEKLDELKQKVVETYKSIAEEALSSIDEINKAQESFEKKLSDYGHLYEIVKINAGDEVITYGKLADLSAQQKELEEYYDILMKVKERGSLPNDFFAMLRDMSIEEGMFYANALLSASDEDYNKYLSDYEEKKKKEKELSKLIYQDDAEILGQEITSSFEKIESEFFGIGGESAYEFGEGFIEEWNVAKENVQSAIAGAFASLFTNPVVEEKVTSEIPELFEDGMDEAAQDTLLMLEELSTDFLNIGQIWGTYVGKGFMEQFKNTLTSLKTSVDVEGYGAKTMVFQTQINQDITATPQTAFETSEQTRRVMENLMGQAVLA